MKFKLFEKISKDELDVALENAHKQCLQYLDIISKLRVEFDNIKDTYKKELTKRLLEKDNKIKELEKKLNKQNEKYV